MGPTKDSMLVNRCITRLAGRQNTSVLDVFESILTIIYINCFLTTTKTKKFSWVIMLNSSRFAILCSSFLPFCHRKYWNWKWPFSNSPFSPVSCPLLQCSILFLQRSLSFVLSQAPLLLLHSHRSSLKLTVHSPHPDSALLIGEYQPQITGGFLQNPKLNISH